MGIINLTPLILSFACWGKGEIEEPSAPVDTGSDIEHVVMVEPYLQSVGKEDAWVLWITESGEQSLVEWGTTDQLGSFTNGETETEGGIGYVHSVHLEGLQPGTQYFYKTRTGGSYSQVYHFKTAPDGGDEPFQIVAMSDMQRDDAHPDKFGEIIQEGVIPHLSDRYSPDMPQALAMVLVPGDLVDSGWVYTDWINDFFAASQVLMAEVPFYPIYGNHEASSPLFARYFHLPDNGTVGYEEHWWSTDYNTVRIVGLDSNQGFRIQTQLDWLEDVLAQTCTDPNIDFLFAQIHHPHLSELWLPGETDFTGDVISQLEEFTSNCGKPSVHFFGHTHGYSRGQSMEHRHLWVNVASAGGALDRWGITEQADYEQFTVSQDQYGFVVLEVTPGDGASFTLERISRGTPDTPLDNQVTDSVTIRFHNTPPETPLGVSSTNQAGVVTLMASEFSDLDGDLHGASHWQVVKDCGDFSGAEISVWNQWQNQYMGEDTMLGSDLTTFVVNGLDPATQYCWQVRYRDRGLEWSAWSVPVEFTTEG